MSQQLEALELANLVRRKKKEAKREIRDGGDVVALIRQTTLPLTVSEVVLAIPHWGPARLKRVCRIADVQANKRLTHLTENQRERLALVVADRLNLKTGGGEYQRRLRRGRLVA